MPAHNILCRVAMWLCVFAAGFLKVMQSQAAETETGSKMVEPFESTMHTMLLLHDANVRTELKLSIQQATNVDALLADVEYPFFLLRDAAPKARDAGLAPIQDTIRQKLATTLNTSQRARLNQLLFQARGVEAIASPETATRLGLSEDQITRIAKIRADMKQAADQAKKDDVDRKPAEQAKLRTERASKEYRQIVEVLSDKQRSTLNSLIGVGFDLSRLKWVTCTAPELRNVETWLNTEPLELKRLRGKVVIVHFWAFGCINCIRNLPHYQKWHEAFSPEHVTIIGIHTPETERERSADNLRKKVDEYGIKYPVAFDAASDNWRAWANNMWPSVYLVDKQGHLRQWWYGELNWQGGNGEEFMRAKIQELIDEK